MSKITLFEYSVYLNKDGDIETQSSLLEKEKWEDSMKELPEYENKIIIANFLGYLKKIQEELNFYISTYFRA